MTDKGLCIETEEIQTDGKDTYYCHRYEPTPYEVLDELFTFYTPEKTDVFVDYGCGMGRLNFYIEKRYSLSSTGVEYSPVYYEKALENKKTYNGNKDKIHFVNCKAEDYLVSKNETVFYFFNPFSPEIFHAVINRILDSFEKYPRTITLILYYPEDDTVFYLERHTTFERMTKLPPPMPFTKTVESDFAFIGLPSKNLLLLPDCSNDPRMLPIFQIQHRTSMCQLPLRLLPAAHQCQTRHFFCHQFHREQP